MKTVIKGAISPDMLIIQHECSQQFKNWIEQRFQRYKPYKFLTYCDGEMYARFGNGLHVTFRQFVLSKIAKEKK